jgi:hypothetical protein
MANRGATPDQIKNEYNQYLKTFYHHPGGVDWNPKLDVKNVDSAIAQQPVAKDGKRLLDCEGFSVMTESILGGIKKNNQPMFDIRHAGSDAHVVCGVFPHGGDPTKGFVVDNASVSGLPLDPRLQKDYNASPGADTRMRFLLREHMKSHNEGTATTYGETYSQMKPPPSKVAK